MRNAYETTKADLFDAGMRMASEFLLENSITEPTYRSGALPTASKPRGTYGCGHYLPNRKLVWVSPDDCASPATGLAVRQWSFPCYQVDRTPVGVAAHEVGHFVDHMLGYASDAVDWRWVVRGKKVSSYEPNASEAFAETVRLFITNPALLACVAPKRSEYLRHALGLKPAPTAGSDPLARLRAWGAAPAILRAAANKV